jgi:hypothetical protein
LVFPTIEDVLNFASSVQQKVVGLFKQAGDCMYEIILETSAMTIVRVEDRIGPTYQAWINGGKEVPFFSEKEAILFAWNY